MSDKATPIDQWSLDQDNHTAYEKSVRVHMAPAYAQLSPDHEHIGAGRGVYLRVTDELQDKRIQQMRLDPEQARAVATMLLYAADQAEKQASA